MKVVVIGFGRKLTLSPHRAHAFRRELAACKRRGHWKGTHPNTAPDCHVEVRHHGKKTRYGIYGRTVIKNEKNQWAWQFYFGLLLLEWLAE